MPRRLRTKADQNRLLIEIHARARRFAIGEVDDDVVEDIAADIALNALVRLRSKMWTKLPKNLQALVRKMTANRVASFHRDQKVERANLREFQRIQQSIEREWMSPDPEWDEASIDEYQAEVMRKLPRRCRLAYYLVRVEGDSYEQAAERMQVTTRTICKYIVHAHRVFREELRAVGVNVPEPRRIEQRAHVPQPPIEPHIAPRYVARQMAHIASLPA
jgi:DNA-directed RNA polymerase specialized sigma24 family protein